MPLPTLVALLTLAISATVSLGFVAQRGGLDLSPAGGAASASTIAVVESPTPAPSLPPSPAALESPTDSPATSATATPMPSPTPTSTSAPTTSGTSSRYALLTACPDQPDCYLYTVRKGDSLTSIGRYFGVPLSTIYAWNPKYTQGFTLLIGAKLRLPPPTR